MRILKPSITRRIYRVVAGSARAVDVRHFRGYGVHSPFVYSLVRQVFMRRRIEGPDTALYTELILRHVSRRRAIQLQNLYTHCGYGSYCFMENDAVPDLTGVGMCIVLRDCDLERILNVAEKARQSGTTVCILAPRDERTRSRQCRRLVAEHPGTSVDNRGYLLLFNHKYLPKQHLVL